MLIWVQQLPIRPAGFYTNPYLPHPNRLTKKHVLIKRHMITHDKIRCPADLIAQCFDCNNTVSLGFFLLIKSLCLNTMPGCKVCCFYICPARYLLPFFRLFSSRVALKRSEDGLLEGPGMKARRERLEKIREYLHKRLDKMDYRMLNE